VGVGQGQFLLLFQGLLIQTVFEDGFDALVPATTQHQGAFKGPTYGYPDYLVGMRERKVADKLNPQRISWLMARSVRSLAREQILHQTGDAQDQQQ
jgi:hypothetical protein